MTGKIKKIISIENGDNFVADIEDIENRITQNSSNLESAKQELSNKCNEALSQAKAYTDQEKAKLFNSTNGTFTGDDYYRDVNNSVLRFNGGNTRDGGASLMLYGKDATISHGGFDLVACTKEDASDAKQLIGLPNGTLTWNGVNLVPTGEIKWFAFNTPPYGYLVCNGANISRETYADLFAVIGTAFGSGDGSTTFALPNLIDKLPQGSTTVGTYKGPGLPNITGTLSYMVHVDTSAINNNQPEYGAFSALQFFETSLATQTTTATRWSDPSFDASRSNSIYGNSTTVQPPALTLLPCIKF